MVDTIKSSLLAEIAAGKPDAGKPAAKAEGGDSFYSVLKDSIDQVNGLQQEADKMMEGLAKGETKNIHETMIAIEKANVSFNMMLQVRNKLLSAYEEVMRMQI